MNERPMYSRSQMGIIYAALVMQSTVQMTNVLLSVFMLDGVEFVCHTTLNGTFNSTCPGNRVDKCLHIEYNRSMWTHNLIMEMNLVCDRAWMRTLPYYGWFAGMFINTLTMQLADVFGRWTLIFVGQAGLTLTMFLLAASKSIYLYSVMRAFNGLFGCLTYQAYYAFYIESLTVAQRSRQGSVPDVLSGLSPPLNALVAYFARDWRHQVFIIGASNAGALLIMWFLPKSEMWVATRQEAEATMNKVDRLDEIKAILKRNVTQFKLIIGSPSILRVSLIMMLIHATSPLCWQVIGLTVGELFGSIFVNTTIMGIADVVANILLILILPRFPRQILHSLNFAALGISLVTSSVLRGFFYDSTRLIDVILMIIAKFFSSTGYAMGYLVTSEVFPTVVRSTGYGFAMMPGRIFLIFYSYIMHVGADGRLPWVSPLIMGTLSLTSAFFSLGLPDTRQVKLLQTIEESETFYESEQTILAKFIAKFGKRATKVMPQQQNIDQNKVS